MTLPMRCTAFRCRSVRSLRIRACAVLAVLLMSASSSAAQLRELRVGPVLVDTEIDTAIFSASQLSRLTERGLVVADLQTQSIVALDRDGKVAWRAGRRGEGPGEFRAMGSLWITDGEVYVHDATLRRTSVFGLSTGRYLRSEILPPPSAAIQRVGRANVSLGGNAGCRLWVVTRSKPSEAPSVGVFADAKRDQVVEVWSMPDSAYAFQVVHEGRPITFWQSYRKTPRPGSDMSTASLVVASRARFAADRVEVELSRYDACGTLKGAPRNFILEPVPVPPGQRDRLEKDWVAAAGRLGMASGAVKSLADKRLVVPAVHPPLITLEVGSDGRAFGRRSGEAPEASGPFPRRWVVFPREGEAGAPIEFTTDASTSVIDVMGSSVLLRKLPDGPQGRELLRVGTIH